MPAPLGCFVADSITIGSASKSFWGGLRIGWLRVPDSRSAAVIAARLSLDLGAPVLEQLVLLQLLASESEIMSWRRAQLRASRDVLVAALQAELPSWTVPPPRGGLAVWAELPEPVSSTLTAVAERYGLLLASGPSFAPEGGLERYLRLPYTLPPASLVQAVSRLRLAWDETLANGTAHPGRRTFVA
jgi:DNA-binding transcriptional MocR family regulator